MGIWDLLRRPGLAAGAAPYGRVETRTRKAESQASENWLLSIRYVACYITLPDRLQRPGLAAGASPASRTQLTCTGSVPDPDLVAARCHRVYLNTRRNYLLFGLNTIFALMAVNRAVFMDLRIGSENTDEVFSNVSTAPASVPGTAEPASP